MPGSQEAYNVIVKFFQRLMREVPGQHGQLMSGRRPLLLKLRQRCTNQRQV